MMSDIRAKKGLKRHDSIYVEVTSVDSSPNKIKSVASNRSNLVHVAEVHDSTSKLLGSSGDENWAQQRNLPTDDKVSRKQPIQLRKRFRQPKKGSETDTLSEVESGDASGDGGKESSRKPHRQDTEDTSDRSSQSKTLVVPSARHNKKASPADVNTSSMDTSSTKDSQDYITIDSRKVRHREPRRGSLTDTLSEATDSESTIARRPVPPPRPSLDTTGDSQELFSQESMDQPQPPVRLKKLKRKKKGPDGSHLSKESDEASLTRDDHLTQDNQLKATGDEMLVVHVEGCDSLRFLDFCRCPAVRLHVVDPVTGEYKTSVVHPGTSVQPLETQPFNMKLHRSVKPTFDEDLVIREPSSLIVSKQCLLLFELFDFVKRNTVAWGFLKLVASNGASNVGRPLRLQLFKPTKNGKHSDTSPKVYSWWSKGKYSQYKSTLYISVNCISSSKVEKVLGSAPQIRTDQDQVDQVEGGEVEAEEEVVWTRYPGQSCKLPNSLLSEKECGKDGALCLAFSHRGRLLAVPTSSGIQIYSVPSSRLHLSLDKQQGLIYDISWSEDDECLVSVSADSTACLWFIKKKIPHAIKVLTHPTYVYSCCWINNDMFATGCSDGVVRVWSVTMNGSTKPNGPSAKTPAMGLKSRNKDSHSPVEFLSKHLSRVNSLCSVERSTGTQRTDTTDGDKISTSDYILISADNNGIIIVWRYDIDTKKFDIEKEVKMKDIKGQVISKVVLTGKSGDATRILVQTRDSLIRLIDLNTSQTLQVYEGGYIAKSKTSTCSLCGCNRRVWSPSEDSSLVVWDFATGERVALYSVERVSPHAHLSLALHPLDHILAYTSYSPSDYPILRILNYDREGDGSNVGQVLLEHGRRGSVAKWSALDTPLYEVPPVRIQPPPMLKRPATPATPSSRLSPVPTPVPRSTRRFSGEGPKIGLESVASALKVNTSSKRDEAKKSDRGKAVKPSTASRIPLSSRKAEVTKEKSTDQDLLSRDSRLSDIIGKMDLILIQASPGKRLATVK